MDRSSEHNMQGWCVNDEHSKAGAGQNAKEVILVCNDAFAEWEGEFCFDGEDLVQKEIIRPQNIEHILNWNTHIEALHNKNGKIDYARVSFSSEVPLFADNGSPIDCAWANASTCLEASMVCPRLLVKGGLVFRK